jgi:hypothetical protein
MNRVLVIDQDRATRERLGLDCLTRDEDLVEKVDREG